MLAAAAFIAPGALMLFTSQRGFLTAETFALRLTPLDETGEAANVFKWMVAGSPWRAFALFLPLALFVPTGIQIVAPGTASVRRRALALVVVPVLVALIFAIGRVSWWATLDGVLLVALVALLAGRTEGNSVKRAWPVLAALPGLFLLLPPAPGEPTERLRIDLAERDFAHWLGRHAGEFGALALAPPNLTVSLYYHGGVHGLGTPYRRTTLASWPQCASPARRRRVKPRRL